MYFGKTNKVKLDVHETKYYKCVSINELRQ